MSRRIWLLVGGAACAGLFLLCGGGAFVLFSAMRAGHAEISEEIDALLASAHEGRFAATYEAATTTAFQKVTSAEEYQQIGDAIARLGALKSKSMSKFTVSQQNARTIAAVSYSAKFERGPAVILAKFQKEGSRWKLLMLTVQSPIFTGDIASRTCPDCGGVFAPSAKFCPHCGKAVPVEESSPEDRKEI